MVGQRLPRINRFPSPGGITRVCHNETELEDPQDLRAKVRKFLILTNERKQMSKTTLRKRIALTATTALFAGMLSVASTPVASANLHSGTVGTETANPVLTAAGSFD